MDWSDLFLYGLVWFGFARLVSVMIDCLDG